MSEKNNYTIDCGIGILAGCATKASLKKGSSQLVSKQLIKNIQKVSQTENDEFLKGAIKVYQDSGLAQKGVTIHHIDNSNWSTALNNLTKTIFPSSNNKLKNAINECYIKKLQKAFLTIANGLNACHMPKTKSIYVNKDKMAFSIFHEMGHAINANSSGIKKLIHKIKSPSKIVGAAAFATAMLTNRKDKNDPTRNGVNKTTDFIKDNCGKIVFLSALPTLIEEGLASFNGAKMAKKVLNNDMYKKLNKLNFKAWGTYLNGAVIAGVGSALAVYIKDKIAGNKPVKQRPFYAQNQQAQYAYYQAPRYRA